MLLVLPLPKNVAVKIKEKWQWKIEKKVLRRQENKKKIIAKHFFSLHFQNIWLYVIVEYRSKQYTVKTALV